MQSWLEWFTMTHVSCHMDQTSTLLKAPWFCVSKTKDRKNLIPEWLNFRRLSSQSRQPFIKTADTSHSSERYPKGAQGIHLKIDWKYMYHRANFAEIRKLNVFACNTRVVLSICTDLCYHLWSLSPFIVNPRSNRCILQGMVSSLELRRTHAN